MAVHARLKNESTEDGKYHNLMSWLNYGLFEKYCKASDRLLECEECEKRFHASCSKLGDNELLRTESGDGAWY